MNPITQPIYHDIQQATTARELFQIKDTVIPHAVGITEDERAQLKLAVDRRFGALNAASVGAVTPRWG